MLGALCAALVSIFGKVGMKDVNADVATALRAIVQAGFVVAFATIAGVMSNVRQLHGRAITMIVLSGVAGGLSWIFMFRALRQAQVSQVGPIDKLSMPIAIVLAVVLLHERPSAVNWLGIAMIVAGVYLAAERGM